MRVSEEALTHVGPALAPCRVVGKRSSFAARRKPRSYELRPYGGDRKRPNV